MKGPQQLSRDATKASDHWAILSVQGSRRKPMVSEYVDLNTGEIIGAEAALEMKVRSIRPDAMNRRIRKLDSLRKEPRQFANFMLQLRDERCKFLVPIETIIQWYSRTTGKEPHHVRRYLSSLIKAEIIDEEGILNEDFMIHNPTADKRSAKGDLCRAYNVLDLSLLRAAF